MYKFIHNQFHDDFEWLRCIQQNNDTALVCLVRKYYVELYKYGLRFTVNEELIKKCILDVFSTLWKERPIADKILSPRMYFFKAMRYRLQKNLLGFQYNVSGNEQHYSDRLICQICSDVSSSNYKVQQNNLSDKEQEVIYLKFCQKLANREIADLMNIDQASVTRLQLFAIKKMSSQIKRQPFPGEA